MGTNSKKKPRWLISRKENLRDREGYAGRLKNTTSIWGSIPHRDTSRAGMKVSGTTDYGLYYDKNGWLTAGIGHRVKKHENPQDFMTMDKAAAFRLLGTDLKKHDKDTALLLKRKGIDTSNLTRYQKDALNDFVFQLGATKASKFPKAWKKLKEATRTGKHSAIVEATNEFLNSKWGRNHINTRAKDFSERMQFVPETSSDSLGPIYGPSDAELMSGGTSKQENTLQPKQNGNYNVSFDELKNRVTAQPISDAAKSADFRTKMALYAQVNPESKNVSAQVKAVDKYFSNLGYNPDNRVADNSTSRPSLLNSKPAVQGTSPYVLKKGEAPVKPQDAQDVPDIQFKYSGSSDLGARSFQVDKGMLDSLSKVTVKGMGDDLVNKFTDRNAVGFLVQGAISKFYQTNEVDPHFNIKKQDSELYHKMTEGLEADAIVDILDNSHNRGDFIKNASLEQGKLKRKKQMENYTREHPVLSGVNSVSNIVVEGGAFMPVGELISATTKATKVKSLAQLTKSRIGSYALGETVEQGAQEYIWSKNDRDYEFDPIMFSSSIAAGVGLKSFLGDPAVDKAFRDFMKDESGFINIATHEGKKLVDEVAKNIGDNQAIALAQRIAKKKTKVANSIRADLEARRTGMVRRMSILDRRIKAAELPAEIKKLKGAKQRLTRQLKGFDKNLPKQLEKLADGTHPKLLAEVNPQFKVSTIAKELGIPHDAVSSLEKTRKFLGLDRPEVDPNFVLEGEKEYMKTMRNQLKEMAENKRLNMNESLRYAAGTGVVKSLDNLPVIGKLQIGNALHRLADTDGPLSRFAFNKGNLVSSDNPYVSSYYNYMASDGMGRQGASKIRAIESQQKYSNIYGGQLLNLYHTHGNKMYEAMKGKNSKFKAFFSPDDYEESIAPLLKARLLDPEGKDFRIKYGDEIADSADAFYKDFNKLNKDIVARAKAVGVEGVDFDTVDGWFHRSWDFRKARGVDKADLKDTVFQAMLKHAKKLGIKSIDESALREHAGRFAHGLQNADMTKIDGLQADHIKLLEKLLDKSDGVEAKVVRSEVERLKYLKQKAKAGDLANRVQMDVTVTLPDGRPLSDLFEDNIIHTQKRYTARMSARIAAAEHGIKNINQLDDWINDAVKEEIKRLAKKGIKNPAESAKFVETAMRQDLNAFKHGGMVGLHDLPDDTANAFVRGVKKYNFARLMQYAGLSSIGEFGTALVEAGVSSTLGELGRTLRHHFNDLYLDNPDMYTGRLYDELRTITGVGMEDFAFTSKGVSKAERIFDTGALNKVEKGVDVLGRMAQAPFGGIEKVGRRVMASSLAIKWANHFKGTETGGVISAFFGHNGFTNRVLENSGLGTVDKLGKFTPNATYHKISREILKNATFDDSGRLVKLNLEKWDNNIAHSFGDIIQMQANHIMINPDATTMALWQSTSVGQILNQFRTFTINATTKVAGATIANAAISANRGDYSEMVKAGQKIFWGTSLGMLSVAIRQGIQRAGGDKEVDLFDEGLIKAAAIGFSRSSVAGNLPVIADSMSGFFGYDPIFNKTSSTGRSQNFFNLATTPTGQALTGIFEGAKKGAQGDVKGGGMQLLKASPLYRQVGMQQIFNFVDKEKK